MVASDVARAALIGGAAAAVIADAAPSSSTSWQSWSASSLPPFRPAQAALTPTLARTPDELTAANVVASAIESVGIFGGPAIGGLLLAATGTATVFVVTAATLLWSAVLIAGVNPDARAEQVTRQPGSVREELLAGFRDDRSEIVASGYSSVSSPRRRSSTGCSTSSSSSIALEFLGAGEAAVGFLNSAVGIGGVVGAVVAAALVGRRRMAADFGLGIFICGVPIALVAVWAERGVCTRPPRNRRDRKHARRRLRNDAHAAFGARGRARTGLRCAGEHPAADGRARGRRGAATAQLGWAPAER